MDSETEKPGENMRADERVELLGSEVEFVYQKDNRMNDETGLTLNISNSGVAVYSDKEIIEGTAISIMCEGIWDGVRQGTVVWCEKLTNNFFKVGIHINNK